MLAVRLKGEITSDKRLTVEVPADMPPGPVEVIVLSEVVRGPRRVRKKGRESHPLFGMWADRPEAGDPVEFTRELRRKIESRKDGNR